MPGCLTRFSIGPLMVCAFALITASLCRAGTGADLSVCLPRAVQSLDPTDHRSRESQIVIKAMFDSLTTRDAALAVRPLLAESFTALNANEWEVRLKPNVRFHNGDALTARDVRFTFHRVIDTGAIDGRTSPRKDLFSPLAEVRVIDDLTVRFITRTPWPVLPLMLSLQEIVPEAYLTAVGTVAFGDAPVGTGPFRFVEKRADQTLILERFDGYVLAGPADAGTDHIPVSRLTITAESDMIRRMALLKRGETDIISEVPVESLTMLVMNPEIEVMARPASRSCFAELNCRKPPFDDRRVRLAMNYAMDRRMIVDTLVQGRGKALATVLPPQTSCRAADLHPYPYLPERARALLHEAGFPDNYRVSIWCEKNHQPFAGVIAMYLSRCGVPSRVVTANRKEGLDAMRRLSADILVSSWGNATFDPMDILWPKFKRGGRGNYSGYANSEADNLLVRAESSSDTAQRTSFYEAVQRIVYHDVPMIFGYAAEEFYATRSRVKGFNPSPTGMLELQTVRVDPGGSR
ncbi:ABC transporter substrate-binding protein [Desulfatiferula olefinivorans]